LAALTASTALALDASKNVVSVTNTGTGNNVLGTSPTVATPTLTGDVAMTTGNLVIGTSGKGIDFSATPGTGTSELLNDYEEGAWTPEINGSTSAPTGITYTNQFGRYTKIGRLVEVSFYIQGTYTGAGVDAVEVTGLPFTISNVTTFPSISGGTGYLPVDTFFYAINNTTRLSAGMRSTGATSGVKYGDAGVSASNFQMLMMMTYFTD
jgi:hypothetical protein